ncbi:hypothetical protein UCDDS831_g08538 [Diplodia seriata]|uniref:DUF8035 domain-containing protein n=1 Tax=Diplodia seriata TaxID=420778 RepID=A0A0G2FPY4_9PEZI|nr:hypothetical protein UCDDS831_g08538 [Diplodia seriata]
MRSTDAASNRRWNAQLAQSAIGIFPEDPNPIREGVAPMKDAKKGKDIPVDARWTKIDRRLVNPEALEDAKERFEERKDCVIVLRVLTREDIQKLADRTREIREAREEEYQRGSGEDRDRDRDRERERERGEHRSSHRSSRRKHRDREDDDSLESNEEEEDDKERRRAPRMIEPAREPPEDFRERDRERQREKEREREFWVDPSRQ